MRRLAVALLVLLIASAQQRASAIRLSAGTGQGFRPFDSRGHNVAPSISAIAAQAGGGPAVQDLAALMLYRLHALAVLDRRNGDFQRARRRLEVVLNARVDEQNAIKSITITSPSVARRSAISLRGDAAVELRVLMRAHLEFAELLLKDIVPRTEDAAAADRDRELAMHHYEAALRLSNDLASRRQVRVKDEPGEVYSLTAAERVLALNSLGAATMALGDLTTAVALFNAALRVNSSALEPLQSLLAAHDGLGNYSVALDYGLRALAIRPLDARLIHNVGVMYDRLGDETAAVQWWRRAIDADPRFVPSRVSLAMQLGHWGEHAEATTLLDEAEALELARRRHTMQSPLPVHARTLLYSIQLHRAFLYLPMVYASAQQIEDARHRYEVELDRLVRQEDLVLPHPLLSVGAGAMGYYAVYQGKEDLRIRARLSEIYQKALARYISFTAPHLLHGGRDARHVYHVPSMTATRSSNRSVSSDLRVHRRRIRVGFLGDSLWSHSVGLLTSGVFRSLPSDEFELFLLTFDTSPRRDHVTNAMLDALDDERTHHVVLSHRSFQQAHTTIAALQLDVLVFTEIGMHPTTYFLAFARLALRSVVFWGHAVTSGIDSIDYFVSSRLFRPQPKLRDARGSATGPPAELQRRYSECIYEMDGLTTAFPRPPRVNRARLSLTRQALQLPTRHELPLMILLPQTLYKLHPDLDDLLNALLGAVPTSLLAVTTGGKPSLLNQLKARWRRTLPPDIYRRVFFVRQLAPVEFLELAAMSDLVLDPFPVGGGRSSLEVFSVGTPIFGLRSRTSVLQLTLAMYRVMGLPFCCMFDDRDALIAEATRLLHDAGALQALRQQILVNNYKLYDDPHVAFEWSTFLRRILALPPPRFISSAELASGNRTRGRPGDCPIGLHAPWAGVTQRSAFQESVGITMTVITPSIDGGRQRRSLRWVGPEENPLDVVARFAGSNLPPLDELQTAFLGKTLWNYSTRRARPIVDRFFFTFDRRLRLLTGATSATVIIREGDDLYQVVRWQLEQQLPRDISDDDLERQVYSATAMAEQRVPEHMSVHWHLSRAMAQYQPPSPPLSRRRDCVALVVTTCKRLSLFLQTMASLRTALGGGSHVWAERFCERWIVDDNSSPADRAAMQRAFPQFALILKTPDARGHARSLNLALQHVRARYLLYVEDDWVFRNASTFLQDALDVLQSQQDMAQVLLNEHESGWRFALSLSSRVVRFFRHEFGLSDPLHKFAYWPGFSLNPAVWDLARLERALKPANATQPSWFDEHSDVFERRFSLRVWRTGLHVGYLLGRHCEHAGTNVSAYVLNGLPRRFD
ncbi:hypothetical protein ATCC90586_008889 [Pythium insidiosum]|nr:hypothetical protein ATCC90586_008889 [Pythium insidiosum]